MFLYKNYTFFNKQPVYKQIPRMENANHMLHTRCPKKALHNFKPV